MGLATLVQDDRRNAANAEAAGDVRLNFVNVDIRDVARAVLGEAKWAAAFAAGRALSFAGAIAEGLAPAPAAILDAAAPRTAAPSPRTPRASTRTRRLSPEN